MLPHMGVKWKRGGSWGKGKAGVLGKGGSEQSTLGCQSRRRAGKSKSTQFAWHSPPLTITNADMPTIGESGGRGRKGRRRRQGEWPAGLAGIAVMAKTADKSAALPPHNLSTNFRKEGVWGKTGGRGNWEIGKLGNSEGGTLPVAPAGKLTECLF